MTDEILERHVRGAFEGAPSLDASDIGVFVEHGIVTLRGYVGSHAQKTMAEEVALGVYGVRAVANDIEVHVLSGFQQTDTEIAQAAVAALVWNTNVPGDRVTVSVADGWMTLNGMVDWEYQKDAAARAVRDLPGVKGVANSIIIQPGVNDGRNGMCCAHESNANLGGVGTKARRVVRANQGPCSQ